MVKNVSHIEKTRLTEQSNVVLKDSCLEDICCQREINPVDIRRTEGNTQFTGKYKHDELFPLPQCHIVLKELFPLSLCHIILNELFPLSQCHKVLNDLLPLSHLLCVHVCIYQ
jgi:hypothetical protein